jgi:hypothetical protein
MYLFLTPENYNMTGTYLHSAKNSKKLVKTNKPADKKHMPE